MMLMVNMSVNLKMKVVIEDDNDVDDDDSNVDEENVLFNINFIGLHRLFWSLHALLVFCIVIHLAKVKLIGHLQIFPIESIYCLT